MLPSPRINKLWPLIAIGSLLTIVHGCSRNAEPVAPQAIAEAEVASTEAPSSTSKNGPSTVSKSPASKKPSAAPAGKQPKAAKKATQIVWEKSFEAALAKAKSSGKPIMIDFFAVWCGPCKMLDQETYTAPVVIAESANFINVKVDGEKRPDLMQRYNLDGFPSIVLTDSDGQAIEIMPGFLPADRFVDFMRSGLSKHGVAVVT